MEESEPTLSGTLDLRKSQRVLGEVSNAVGRLEQIDSAAKTSSARFCRARQE
jgi:hypothetical protein